MKIDLNLDFHGQLFFFNYINFHLAGRGKGYELLVIYRPLRRADLPRRGDPAGNGDVVCEIKPDNK